MAADVVLTVVETDLRLLAAEAKKAEGPMTNLMGMLHHSDLPAVKDATERALQKIRSVEHSGLPGVRQAVEILAPFALACDTKYAKLACIALSAFQKLLANDAVSIRGRCEIIKALQAAERLSDESVKLRILQASLTIIQSSSFADEQDAVQQLLSVIFRVYLNNKSNFAVHSTAAATIRQAVALVFDHSVLKPPTSAVATPTVGSPAVPSPLGAAAAASTPPSSTVTPVKGRSSVGGANTPGPPIPADGSGPGAGDGGQLLGREVVPVLLLEEIMGWLGGRDGKELGWIQLQQRGSNKMDRTFLLEMLEAVLLQRAAAIHRLPGLVQCLRTKVAPAVAGLLDSACDRMVDPNDASDCRLVVRCASALVRRHNDLAPERAAAVMVRLAETAGSVGRPGAAHRWQRFMALQALRPLLSDPPLLYRLFHLNAPAEKAHAISSSSTQHTPLSTTFAPSKATAEVAASDGDGTAASVSATGGNVLPQVVRSLHDALRWYVRTSIETPEDDVVAALGNLYLQRAMGARDSVQETEAFGTNLAHGSEVVIAHLALECVLAMVASTEALTDVVVVPAEPGMPSPKLITRDTPEVRCAAVAGMVAVLWRSVLAVCNTLLARAAHDVLVGLLVRGLQGVTYSAGALSVIDARDSLLHALCSHTLLPPGEDDMAAVAAAAAAAAGSTMPAAPSLAADDRSTGGSSFRRSLALPTPLAQSNANSFGSSAGSTPAPGFLTAILVDRASTSFRVVLTQRNTAALRSLFNLAHRLADGLGGTGWLYVVDAVNALDRILASPHTTTAAYLAETTSEGDVVGGLQPMASAVVVSGPGAGAGLTQGGGGGGAGGAGVLVMQATITTGLDDGAADDGATTAQRELRILASAADQLFENTHHMSPEAVVSLLSALAEISHRTLSGLGLLGSTAGAGPNSGGAVAAAATVAAAVSGGGTAAASPGGVGLALTGGSGVPVPGGAMPGGPSPVSTAAAGSVRLCALNRMVDTLLHNLWRIQDLWGIFLAHVLEVLSSGNVQVRAAAVDALDRTITSALNPNQHVPDKFTAPLPAPEDALSPGAAAAVRRDLLLTFPSYAITPPPMPTGSQPSAAASTSRRSSRDISSRDTSLRDGKVDNAPSAVTSPHELSGQTPLQRRASGSSGAATAFSRPSLNFATALAVRPPALNPSPVNSPFAQGGGAVAAAAAAAASSVVPAFATVTATVAPNRGVQQAAQREDVQHMLLVALDSLYREGGRSPDVRHGLLRIALHVLQHHGDGLTRGWVPLLRLLETVPRGGLGPADIRLGFQVVEILATDYLASSLPKEHVAKALDVIAKFAMQDVVLNVSLTAITMLWNATDHLARSRGTFSKAAAAVSATNAAAAAAAAAAAVQPPQASLPQAPSPAPAAQPRHSTVTPTLGTFSGGTTSGSSPFGNTLYGSSGAGGGSTGTDSTPSGERQMSPAFAAALSFARGVPSLPAVSPQRPAGPQGANSTTDQSPTQTTAPSQGQPGGQIFPVPPAGAVRAGGAPAVAGGASYPLHDLDEAESIAMLMIAFRSLKTLSVDPRPEARNAAVRTLFLAVGSHGSKFPPATWDELFWSLLFDLLITIHRVSANSSVEEAAAVELGKEKGGRSVVMLVHHSRNSEQKQWDETLVLALAGAAKVLRSYLPVLSGLDVWNRAWEQLMQVLGDLLASGRKGVSMASTSLLTTILQTHGSGLLVTKDMWKQSLAALDRGVITMAAPNTPAPLQARAELLSCITILSVQLLQLPRSRPAPDGDLPSPAAITTTTTTTTTLSAATPSTAVVAAAGAGPGSAPGPGPDPEQLLMVLRWLDRFARYPVGSDDTSPIHFTTIGPIQKAVLGALAALPTAAAAAGVWPEVLSLLCNMLRPYSTLALRQHAQQVAAVQLQRRLAGFSGSAPPSFALVDLPTPSSSAPACSTLASGAGLGPLDTMNSSISAGLAAGGSSREPSAHGGSQHSGANASGGSVCVSYCSTAEVMEARAMSPVWMARVVELLANWYRDHVSWQVRVATFPLLVGAISECMACRHLVPLLTADPPEQLDDLWRTAARGFVMVVQSGLPSINITCSSQGVQQPQQRVPHSTWPALARAYQMFFLASNLPPVQQPPPEAQQALTFSQAATAAPPRRLSTSGGSPGPGPSLVDGPTVGGSPAVSQPSGRPAPPAPSLEQMAADLEITTAVLDCMTDTVLSACQHAPLEVRRALVEVLDAGAASVAAPATAGVTGTGPDARTYDESSVARTSRLSYVCLNKLYVLCSRGQEAPDAEGREVPGVRAQLEVAQIALPVFVARCEAILIDYNRADLAAKAATAALARQAAAPGLDHTTGPIAAATNGGGTGTSTPVPFLTPIRTSRPPAVPAALHDKARHVLELLPQLKVLPVVSDSLLGYRPHLRFWLEVSRAVRAQAAMPPPSLAAAAAAAAAAAPGAGPSVGSLAPAHSIGAASGSAAGMLTPPALSRRSSSGVEALSPKTLPGSVAGDAAATSGAPPGRPSSSSFFSRTYSSTGALLSSSLGALAGSGASGTAPGAPAMTSMAPSPRRPSGASLSGSANGSGGGGGALLPESRGSGGQLHRMPSAGAGSSAAATAAATVGALVPPSMTLSGKLAWAKEQPQLTALYGVLCECVGSSDADVRTAVQGMLLALGGGVGLCVQPHHPHAQVPQLPQILP